jgi:ABC-type branched-subunit amino acid transport system ATPase component
MRVDAHAAPAAARADADPILQVRGLKKQFRGLVATNDLSFEIRAGTVTSVIGPNGAGKSTLFNLLTGYCAPDGGEIRFGPWRLNGLPTTRIAQLGVARAFQIAKPFRDLSVADNVRVGALFGKSGPRDVAEVTQRALRLTGLAPLADSLAGTLTVGQLRRLEIARALATRATLLLADEPCAGLNAAETADMIEVLRTARAQGVTVVLVEHDMPSVMSVSDHILVLEAGTLIASGGPKDVASNPRVIQAYLGTADGAGK